MTSNRCFHIASNFKTLPTPKDSPSCLQLLRIWRSNNNTNRVRQTMDKSDVSILHIRMDKDIQTASHKKQTQFSQDHSLISRDLVQSTPCLSKHGEIVTTTLRIRPWEASIIILKVMNFITNEVTFMCQEVVDVDRDVDISIIIILVFLILSPLFILNRLQQVHIWRHCLQLQIPITQIQVINKLMF